MPSKGETPDVMTWPFESSCKVNFLEKFSRTKPRVLMIASQFNSRKRQLTRRLCEIGYFL
ncbi:conserved hypothetical protein [delta proteobacterium NaphS2]|nr:conserved hypothetical protein [delta proteobacterium NaphS2]